MPQRPGPVRSRPGVGSASGRGAITGCSGATATGVCTRTGVHAHAARSMTMHASVIGLLLDAAFEEEEARVPCRIPHRGLRLAPRGRLEHPDLPQREPLAAIDRQVQPLSLALHAAFVLLELGRGLDARRVE